MTVGPGSHSKDSMVVCLLMDQSLMVDSSQCSTTGVTKVVVCANLFVGWCI